MTRVWDALLLAAFVGGLFSFLMTCSALVSAGWSWARGRRRAPRPLARPLEEVFQDGARAAFAYAMRQADQLAETAKDRLNEGLRTGGASSSTFGLNGEMGALANFAGRCKAWTEQLPHELEDRSA